jgi:cell division protease FtsH
MQIPLEDKYTYKKLYVEGQIAILMGGRIAEELTQEDITTGAGNDIERATEMARRMVCEWGMSKLGPLSFGSKDEPVFLGRDFTQRADYSEDTALQIDREVNRIVQSAYERAKSILTDQREVLERLARVLLERESLDGKEVYEIIQEMTGQDLAPETKERPDISSEEEGGAVQEASGVDSSSSQEPPPDEVEVAAAHRSTPADPLPSTE